MHARPNLGLVGTGLGGAEFEVFIYWVKVVGWAGPT